jgi:hypothetical protein
VVSPHAVGSPSADGISLDLCGLLYGDVLLIFVIFYMVV